MQSGVTQNDEKSDKAEAVDLAKLTLGAPRQNFGRGLYLLPRKTRTESHGWRLDYQFGGKRKTLSLGTYPEVSEDTAQDLAGTLRQQIATGLDPSKERRKKKRSERGQRKAAAPCAGTSRPRTEAGSFREVAERWYAGKQKVWDPEYAEKQRGRLNNHLYPLLGRRPIGEIEPADLLEACQRAVEDGKADTARRVCKIASGVLSLAVVEGWATRNFSKEVLDQLPKYHKRNFAAITDPRELATLLKDIWKYHGTFPVTCALKLAPMLMLRPGELRETLWSDVDLENGIMIVPAERVKRAPEERPNAEDHVVPLAKQAVAILEVLFQLTGRTGVVFPCNGSKGKFMSANTLNKALRIMGYCTQEEVTTHGFRATARTMLTERLEWDEKYAEMQLAHVVPDLNGTAYNRTEFEDDRVRMMQEWADYLDALRAETVAFKLTLRQRFTPVTNRTVVEQASSTC